MAYTESKPIDVCGSKSNGSCGCGCGGNGGGTPSPVNVNFNLNSNNPFSLTNDTPVVQPFVSNPFVANPAVVNPVYAPNNSSELFYSNSNGYVPKQVAAVENQRVMQQKYYSKAKPKLPKCAETFYKEFA